MSPVGVALKMVHVHSNVHFTLQGNDFHSQYNQQSTDQLTTFVLLFLRPDEREHFNKRGTGRIIAALFIEALVGPCPRFAPEDIPTTQAGSLILFNL
jgi:hypothetical protein